MRDRLEAERISINRDYNALGYKIKVIFGYDTSGDLKEIQLFGAKRGNIVFGHLQTVSFLISKLLQYRSGVESIAKRLETFDYEPSGWCNGVQYRSLDHFISQILRDNKKYKDINGKEQPIQDTKPKEVNK